jgi:hypothetical protein
MHAYQEGVISLQENIFLQFGRLYLVVVQNNVLTQTLHGINLLVRLLLHQENLSEAASANNFPDFKVAQSSFRVAVLSECCPMAC